MVPVTDGDLAVDRNGVTYKPFTLHGSARVQTWPWPSIRRVAVEDGGRKHDRVNLAFGFLGLLFRSARVTIVVSLSDRDVIFETKQPIAELRAEVRRLHDDNPALRDKLLI